MASNEYHDDLTLMGRLTETFQGATVGLEHGARVLVGIGKTTLPISGENPKKKLTSSSPPNQSKSVKEFPEFKIDTSFGRKTYIYEQPSLDSHQLGPLRAIGTAKERSNDNQAQERFKGDKPKIIMTKDENVQQ